LKRVETTFVFRDYEFVYLFGVDGEELQPYKTFSGIIQSCENLTTEDEPDLYMLAMGQRLKQENPNYDPKEEADVEFFQVSYLPKTVKNEEGEEEEIHYVLEKRVNYDEFKDTTHVNKQKVVSTKEGLVFIHRTARTYILHEKVTHKTSGSPDKTLRYWMELTLKEDELEKMKTDGSAMSTVLYKVEFKFFYN
jgi:hypothetical protein